MDSNSIIRFDWAAKRLLRDKANYAVLEGLVTVLLNEKITIVELLESESNQDTLSDKFNRVDIKAKDSRAEGEYNKAISVAMEMKKLKIDVAVISHVSGLSEDEINNI